MEWLLYRYTSVTYSFFDFQSGSDDILYLGTGLGIYYRKAGMSQWELFWIEMQACRISFIHINYAKGKLRVSISRGVWETDLLDKIVPKANMFVIASCCPLYFPSSSVQFQKHFFYLSWKYIYIYIYWVHVTIPCSFSFRYNFFWYMSCISFFYQFCYYNTMILY